MLRSPVIATLGHVDHGKTWILDGIRGSRVAKKEAGGITQMIGTSYITKGDLEETAKALKGKMPFDIKIPGLLFIDTPGHEAFTNLRQRGGSIADMAILVVDIKQGFQPQTIESIKILKHYKTPFLVAANKIDLVDGWKKQNTTSFLESFPKQTDYVKQKFEEKMYETMGKLSEYGFESERFDKIDDFSKQIAIVPVSGKTKEGLSELLILLGGLSQKYLEKNLNIEVKGPGKGSIIEVKEEKGLGDTIDVIIYDGVVKRGDEIIFLSNNGVKSTKIRGLLEPNLNPKSSEDKYKNLDTVVAAAGVKIFAPDLGDAIPGSPIVVVTDFEKDKEEIEKQFKEIVFDKNQEGVVVKADSLGSIEAIVELLKEKEIPIKETNVGKINKKDVVTASAVAQKNKYLGVVLGFNVIIMDEAREESSDTETPIIWSNIIYKIIEDYEEWVKEEKEKEKKKMIESLPWPGKIKIMKGCCFRVCKPAVFGVEVLGGKIKQGARLMNKDVKIVGEIKTIQHEKKNIPEAKKGMQVAISSSDIYMGKDVCEGDVLNVYMNKNQIREWKTRIEILDEYEKEILSEIEQKIIKSAF